MTEWWWRGSILAFESVALKRKKEKFQQFDNPFAVPWSMDVAKVDKPRGLIPR